MHSINMRPIATDGLSGNSSACMCDGHNGDLCNIWLNRSRCHLRNRLVMAKGSTYIRWGCCCCCCCCCWWRAHQLPPSRHRVHTSCQWERLARKSWVMDRGSASGVPIFFNRACRTCHGSPVSGDVCMVLHIGNPHKTRHSRWKLSQELKGNRLHSLQSTHVWKWQV